MASATEEQRPLPPTQTQSKHRSPQRKDNQPHADHRPKMWAKACGLCRAKKIRCDARSPRCTPCVKQGRECSYAREAPRKRPTHQQIADLQRDKATLQAFIANLKRSDTDDREKLLHDAVDEDGTVRVPLGPEGASTSFHGDSAKPPPKPVRRPGAGSTETPMMSSDDEVDISHFISVDDAGETSSFGPSSALHNPAKTDASTSPPQESVAFGVNIRNHLIANAALQRQMEPGLGQMSTIAGIPSELAMHLLNIHWARQHHSFLLTYRPAIMRDLQCSGPYCSNFLLNAIFACSSKYSPRPELRDDPDKPGTAGLRFLQQCDHLLMKECLLAHPQICTVVGLILLGSTYNSRGETSKGWLWTGYGLRMVYDLGLHLDPSQTTDNPEEVEIRRRIFWGAFVCDKLQSLYLGRPVAINLRDSQVSREFYDLYEEKEPFGGSSPRLPEGIGDTMPIHSVSTFQQLCLLSKIMTMIINRFYVVGATFSNAQNSLQQVDKALQEWRENLPSDLDFQPWSSSSPGMPARRQPPNVMILHNLYHSLMILVHRPFISDGHLRSSVAPMRSWERCTVAARCITSIALAYKSVYSLGGAPYMLGYTIYVACTIHVRNAASQDQPGVHRSLLNSSLQCLYELCQANPGVVKPTNIIRRLIEVNKLDLQSDEVQPVDPPSLSFDMDAILNMFPMNNEGGGMDMAGYRMGFGYDMPQDPLFGMMDGPAMSFELQDLSMPL